MKKFLMQATATLLQWVAIVAFTLFIAAMCSSCKTTRVVERVPVVVHDTMETTTHHHDSIYVDRWHYVIEVGDTTYLRDSVYIYQRSIIHDTVQVIENVPVVQVKEVEKTVTSYKSIIYCVICLIVVVIVVFFAIRAANFAKK